MEIAALVGISFVGTVFWIVNAEASAIYYGSALGFAPLLVGLACASGQTAMYVVLYAGGERLTRWHWYGSRIERVRERWRPQLERWFLPCAGLAAVLGFPPALAMPALAPGFAVSLVRVLPVLFAGRLLRFTGLAAAGAWAAG